MIRRDFPPAHLAVPNLAPMIDVVMVILIFFMLGTSFALSEGILPSQLPSQVGPGGAARVSFIPVVRVDLREGRDGQPCRILVMDRPLPGPSFAGLHRLLLEKIGEGVSRQSPVLISASPGVRYQDVISAMDACVRAGLVKIQFLVGGGTAGA
jgi:biopolymer transport protein ExbD